MMEEHRTARIDLSRRYALAPGARIIRRAADCVQVGTEASRSILVRDAPPESVGVLTRLDGLRAAAEVLLAQDADPLVWTDLLGQLVGANMLVAVDEFDHGSSPPIPGAHLNDERAGLIHRHGHLAAGRILQSRDDALVVVRGDSATARSIVMLLAAAGVGHVHHDIGAPSRRATDPITAGGRTAGRTPLPTTRVPTTAGPAAPVPTNPGPTNPGPTNPGPTNPGPTNPGPTAQRPTTVSRTSVARPSGAVPEQSRATATGRIPASTTGVPIRGAGASVAGGVTALPSTWPAGQAGALAAALRAAHPTVRVHPPAAHQHPTIVVLTGGALPDLGMAAAFVKSRIPHLAVLTGVARAVVGPLVLPGRSSCLACADRHRNAADPGWSAVARQLADDGPQAPALVAAAGAQLAAGEVLDHIDGMSTPTTVNGTLEWRAGEVGPRRRTWTEHPDCGCRQR